MATSGGKAGKGMGPGKNKEGMHSRKKNSKVANPKKDKGAKKSPPKFGKGAKM